MKVKLLTGRAGLDGTQDAGQIVEVSDAEGRRMIEAWQAEPVSEPKAKSPATQAPSRKSQ